MLKECLRPTPWPFGLRRERVPQTENSYWSIKRGIHHQNVNVTTPAFSTMNWGCFTSTLHTTIDQARKIEIEQRTALYYTIPLHQLDIFLAPRFVGSSKHNNNWHVGTSKFEHHIIWATNGPYLPSKLWSPNPALRPLSRIWWQHCFVCSKNDHVIQPKFGTALTWST